MKKIGIVLLAGTLVVAGCGVPVRGVGQAGKFPAEFECDGKANITAMGTVAGQTGTFNVQGDCQKFRYKQGLPSGVPVPAEE